MFLDGELLPPPGPELDATLLALMGSPDPMQIDGLGGSKSSTSKVMLIYPSTREDCDVEYLFAQVGIDVATVDYASNCGNLTFAVGPYAIDEGLVEVAEAASVANVRLLNRNTGVWILARVPVESGCTKTTGDCVIAGVRRPGAGIITEYLDPGGALFGTVLPTGHATDEVQWEGGSVAVSIVDVAGPVAFVRSHDLTLDPAVAPTEVNADPALLARLELLRGQCAVLMGSSSTAERALTESPALPRLAIIERRLMGWPTSRSA